MKVFSLEGLNVAIALIIVVRLVVLADNMNGTTRHCFRFTVVALGAASLAWALWPFFNEDWPEWMDSVFLGAVAAYVLLDRRRAFKEGVADWTEIVKQWVMARLRRKA